ncbi:MAG TPA: signal peptidase I [Ruminococcaceae bacterium]|nr:signal peptidase I [Oscillospiraceae bacterium]
MKKVLSKIVNVLTFSVIIALAALIATVAINAQKGKITTVFGYSFMTVQTGSMEPEYPIGSSIVAKKVDASELKVGDVISFYSADPSMNHSIVTHRIKEINSENSVVCFVTKGDANDIDDKYQVSAGDVIGRVTGKSKLVSAISKVKKDPKLFFLVIVVPICAIITWEFVGISKKAKASSNEKKDS